MRAVDGEEGRQRCEWFLLRLGFVARCCWRGGELGRDTVIRYEARAERGCGRHWSVCLSDGRCTQRKYITEKEQERKAQP